MCNRMMVRVARNSLVVQYTSLLLLSFIIDNLNTMNKSNIAHNPHHSFPLHQYLQLAKSRSKEKPALLHRKSKSPPRPATQAKLLQNSQDWSKLQKRYYELQDKYSDLLEVVKNRNNDYGRLKTQVQRYKKMHERDSEQIKKLRFIVGLARKKSVEVQADELQIQTTNANRISRFNKFDQSTQDQIRMRQSGEKFKPKDKFAGAQICRNLEAAFGQKSSKDNIFSAVFPNKQANKRRQNAMETGRFNKQLSNSPYSKLRFVPGGNY